MLDEDEDDVGGASYLSMTYDYAKQFVCRRHFHDGSVMDYGHTALVEPEPVPNTSV